MILSKNINKTMKRYKKCYEKEKTNGKVIDEIY
jgi:hypothetical protein